MLGNTIGFKPFYQPRDNNTLRTFDPAFCPNFCIYLLESYFISLRKFRITTPIELYSINPCSHQTSYFFLMMVSRSQIADKITSIIEGARQLKDDRNRPFRAVSDRKLVQDFARALPKPCKLRDSRGTSVRNWPCDYIKRHVRFHKTIIRRP